jgi:formate hydrogenlyase subunit 3/multisubunit Na+/H+ antiporter MnhD subunit
MTAHSLLVAAAVGWPATLAVAWLHPAVRRQAAPVVATLALPALALALQAEPATIDLRAPGLFTSMALGVDTIGRPFLLLTALLWSIVTVHAVSYVRDDPHRGAFLGFLLVTGTGNIGVTIAQDALSFYLFFAIMTFAAYGLIVHSRSAAALRAGRIYIVMAVLGEALLLVGLFAITALATDATFERVPEAFASLRNPGIVAAALLLGFGIKAGLVPLHMWLPLAHPVAPTPASALLSGAMIKAGVIGWLRFLPVGALAFDGLGAALLALGVTASLYGAAIGVVQTEAKTVLAYSSISQMGFIACGVGGILMVPAAAPLLMLAVAVYALHHALAKAALFLAVGLVPPLTRRSWAWTLAAVLPALALAGAPLTSGAIAKSALKGALGELPGAWSARVDTLLALAAVGTTLLMARFLATMPARADHERRPSLGLLGPWLLLVGLSALAAFWLPAVLAPLGELPLATDPHYVAAALWPIALGALLAAAALLLRRRYPTAVFGVVPPGDIVAPLERAIALAVRVGARARLLPVGARIDGYRSAVRQHAYHAVDGVAARGGVASTGPVVGVALFLMVLLLFLALA